jgi:glycosyltransferase involved in cell wall biosynthesis
VPSCRGPLRVSCSQRLSALIWKRQSPNNWTFHTIMRVLWFTNDPLPTVHHRKGRGISGSGYWILSLLENLRRTSDLELEVATVYPGVPDDQFEEDVVKYFVMGQPRRPYIFFRCRKRDLDRCVELVRERDPDIVHIHGTERFFGLMAARKLISTPCVISLQGLLGAYLPTFFGALSPGDLWRSHRLLELATMRGLFGLHRGFVRGAHQEREVLIGAESFMGRTEWDRAHVKAANPRANYYHVGEVLRQTFREHWWDIDQCERHTVIFTNAGEPRRGTEVLLRAMLTVRRKFPDAKVRLAGQIGTRRGYDRFLRQMIAESGLSETVELLGYLDGSAMARELCRAHVFAISSYIENSPNSLCEAMQVGLPCVATYTGGIPSLVEHGRTGLLFPTGDAPLLADMIMRIFRDDDLACRLGRAARAEASERHAPQRVVSQLLNAYNHVIANGHETYHLSRKPELPAKSSVVPSLESRI